MTKSMLDKLIQRYNRNSRKNYLVLNDLKRTFDELYGLQNEIPRDTYKGLDPEQVYLSYTHNVYIICYTRTTNFKSSTYD